MCYKSSFLAMVTALFFIAGCSKEDQLLVDAIHDTDFALTKSAMGEVSHEDEPYKAFTEDMLTIWLMRQKERGNYKVEAIKGTTPSSCNNTVMYVVNFEDGGWMIFAGHVRKLNQVIAYCEDGQFNPENLPSPEVRYWYEMTLAQMESVDMEVNDSPQTQSSLPYWIDPNEDYYWVRLPYSTEDNIIRRSSTGHLITTQWGQYSPWNIMTPNPYGNQYCYTGCTAVACSQVLYYLKMFSGFNIWIYDVSGTFAYYNPLFSNNDYYYIASITRSNATLSLSKWAGMKQNAYDYGSASYVAELMFDVSERAGMKYKKNGSGAFATTSLFNTYGITSDSGNYSYANVKSSLDASIPVVVTSWTANDEGHTWVIDGYKSESHDVDYSYQWRIIPTDSLRFYNNINYDYVFTDRQTDAKLLSLY